MIGVYGENNAFQVEGSVPQVECLPQYSPRCAARGRTRGDSWSFASRSARGAVKSEANRLRQFELLALLEKASRARASDHAGKGKVSEVKR